MAFTTSAPNRPADESHVNPHGNAQQALGGSTTAFLSSSPQAFAAEDVAGTGSSRAPASISLQGTPMVSPDSQDRSKTQQGQPIE